MQMNIQAKNVSWQNHPATRQLLNSPFYRPYMWARYRIDIATLPAFVATKKNPSRSFHAYVIGTMKSGTTSLGRVLSSRYHARHEALPRQSCLKTVFLRRNKISLSRFREYVVLRDKYLNLDLESSCFLLDWADVLVEHFSEAKFIVPIREPYTWLRSMINQEFSTNLSVKESYWKLLFNEYFQDDNAQLEDEPLLSAKLHSVSAYLKYWNDHHLRLIQNIPKDRLLIFRTDYINENIEAIANFLDIPSEDLDKDRIRQNRTKIYHIDALRDISQSHIRDCIREYCSDSLLQFFPEVYPEGEH